MHTRKENSRQEVHRERKTQTDHTQTYNMACRQTGRQKDSDTDTQRTK